MKKILALILALTMLFALTACGGGGDDKDASSPAASPAASPDAPADKPVDDKADAPADEPAVEGTIGWGTDPVDHFERDPYRIVYMVNFYLPVNVGISNMFELWSEYLNVEYQVQDCQQNNENYLNYLETFAAQDIDGFILDFDPYVTDRIFELCTELELTWIPAINPVKDEAGNYLVPAVCINAYDMGVAQADFLAENYTKYWGDIDPSKIVMFGFDNTPVPDLHNRCVGSIERFEELFPGNKTLTFDMAGRAMSAEEGNDTLAAIITANPDCEYWFITSPAECFGLGATRCIESLLMEDRALVTCCDGAAVMEEWDGGYDGDVWVAAVHQAEVLYAEPIICGLIAMLDGRATAETLWPEHRDEGQNYSAVVLTPNVITRDNYVEFRENTTNYTKEMFGY